MIRRAPVDAIACLALALVVLAGCEREERRFRANPWSTLPPRPAATPTSPPAAVAARASGEGEPEARASWRPGRYDQNAYAIAQGQKWFTWYNCNGCHANGGGGIGPPLIDAKWRYGSDADAIFTTIVDGRPDGMPAFGARVPEEHVWQLVSFVRSLSGLVAKDAAPGRRDDLSSGEPPVRRERQQPVRDPSTPAKP